MTIGPELEMALAAFAAVVAAQLLKGLSRMITSFVKGTPTSIDDKVWAAVSEAVEDVLSLRDAEQEEKTSQEASKPIADAVGFQHVEKD